MAENKTKTIETEAVEPETVEPETVEPSVPSTEEVQRHEDLFYYPIEGVTVKAKSRDEADKLLEQKLKDTKESNNG